jgi:hypothetical protein
MHPVPCLDWASPLEVGTHLRSFHSALPEEPTREVLSALKGDVRLLDFLRAHPLGDLEFSGRLPFANWLGLFDPLERNMIINSTRPPETYGQDFVPAELWSVSAAGCCLVEAMQRSLYHELGHAVLDIAGPEVERQLVILRRAGRGVPVSIRAKRDPKEYFCEAFAAYRFEDSLADQDPEGYDVVEAILRMVSRK